MTSTARLSWPLPPSTISRSGRREKEGSGFLPGVSWSSRVDLPAVESPAEHLFHAGEVIRPDHGADVEAAVELFAGDALLKDHHAADDGGALGIGDIVALDPVGRRLHLKGGLQFGRAIRSGGGGRFPTAPGGRQASRLAFSVAMRIRSRFLPRCGILISTF